MKILQLGREWTHQGVRWPAGSKLVLTDFTAGKLLTEAHPASIVEIDEENCPWFVDSLDAPDPRLCDKVLFVRPGGFGDLLNLLSVVQIFKRDYPGIQVDVCCYDHFKEVFDHTGSTVWSYPMRWEDTKQYDVVYWMEDIVEYRKEGKTTPLFDIMMAFTGLTDPWEPAYEVTANESCARLAKAPRIGVQWHSSSLARNWPESNRIAFITEAVFKGWDVFRLDEPKLTFRQNAAVAQTCDVLVTPDSAFLHLGAHLGVPTVALFGSFPGELRASYYPKVKVIQAQGTCAPCFHHGVGWPKKGPCNFTNQCEVLASISAEQVIKEVETLLNYANRIPS